MTDYFDQDPISSRKSMIFSRNHEINIFSKLTSSLESKNLLSILFIRFVNI
jgi:hypothetical protein